MLFFNYSYKLKLVYFFIIELNFYIFESMVYFFFFMFKIGILFSKIFELEK